MATIFFLSVIETIAAYFPFDHIEVAAAQQQEKNNNNNNTKLLSIIIWIFKQVIFFRSKSQKL
jgi:hypothetical protein